MPHNMHDWHTHYGILTQNSPVRLSDSLPLCSEILLSSATFLMFRTDFIKIPNICWHRPGLKIGGFQLGRQSH